MSDVHIYNGMLRDDVFRVINLHGSSVLRGTYGSTERVEMIRFLVDIFNNKDAWTSLEQSGVAKSVISITEDQISAWIHGAVNGWMADSTTDPQRSNILICAKILKCSNRLMKKLPRIEPSDKMAGAMDDEYVQMDA